MPQYHRTIPHPPPPTAPDDAELDRLTNSDLAAGDAREHARLGQQLRRHVGPPVVLTTTISAYAAPCAAQAAHFRITYEDGGLAAIPIAAALEPTDPDDFP